MDIRAKVTAILPAVSGMGKNGPWKSQTIIVDYRNGDYTQTLALTNKKYPEQFGKIPVGAVGSFRINPHSRESGGKWYTECLCYGWDIDTEKAAPSSPRTAPRTNTVSPEEDAWF